jgi:NAD-dependent dihydropyrimidine dehydrogenase PreA subunit
MTISFVLIRVPRPARLFGGRSSECAGGEEANVKMFCAALGRWLRCVAIGHTGRMPNRPADPSECRQPAGAFHPVVDRAKCEGKSDCTVACPYDVFEVRRIDDGDFAKLSFFSKLKSRAHGRKTAYTPRAEACRACGLCVSACPERAIRLERTP